MANLVRLRIALSDRPGALAAVTTVIAAHGGNITSIDVQHGETSAVDDVVVEFPGGTDLATVREGIAASGAATVQSHQAATAVDPVVAALTQAARMVQLGVPDTEAELIRAVAALCFSPAVWMGRDRDAGGVQAGRYATEGRGAVAVRTASLPGRMAERLPGESWLLAVPDPDVSSGGRMLFVARPLDSEFTTTEIARVEAMISLHNALGRLARPVRP